MDIRTDEELAQILWDYNYIQQKLKKSDCIFALGSHDLRVAERAAELYLQGWAPLIIFSGKSGKLTVDLFIKTEAETFADVALKMGVPQSSIYLEKESTNTGENIRFTKNLIEDSHLNIKTFIVVQKPFMLRRVYAAFMQQWPGNDFIVTAPQIAFKDYPNEQLPKDKIINSLVGDTQRIKEYPSKGFQISQEIPSSVWAAYEELVRRGYTKHLI